MRRLLWRGPYPLHRNEPYEPFFLVGSGRCGTTLLRRMLEESPEVHIPPENWVFQKVVARYRVCRFWVRWEELVHLTLALHEYQAEFHRWLEGSLRPLALRLMEAAQDKRTLAFILDALYRYHGEEKHAVFQRWGDKTPINVFCMKEISAVFPRARFVHLIRDGVDVVHSMIEAERYSDVSSAAARWKSAIASGQRFAERRPGACMDVRYESLVTNPGAALEGVCRFLGITYSDSMVEGRAQDRQMGDLAGYSHMGNVLKPVTTANIGKGRKMLTQEQRKELHRLIGRELERLGYESAL